MGNARTVAGGADDTATAAFLLIELADIPATRIISGVVKLVKAGPNEPRMC